MTFHNFFDFDNYECECDPLECLRSSNKAIIRKHPPRPGSCQQDLGWTADCPVLSPTQDRLGPCCARSLQCSSDLGADC